MNNCKNVKKIIIFGLIVMLFGNITSYAAETPEVEKERGGFKVYSESFPDAYILIKEKNSNSKVRSNENTFGIVEAVVFVEERWECISGKNVVVESRLLSKDEVDKIGMENFESLSENVESRGQISREKLTISFDGTYSLIGSGVVVSLKGSATWSAPGYIYNASTDPAIGDDFLGIVWSGGHEATNSTCVATWDSGRITNAFLSKAVPNAGRVFSFEEYIKAGSPYAEYIKKIDITTTLKKIL